MTGDADDVRLDAAKVAARLDVTRRHLVRLVAAGRFPRHHYVDGRRRWWLSEVKAWEASATTTAPPASASRGAGNLRRGPASRRAPAGGPAAEIAAIDLGDL